MDEFAQLTEQVHAVMDSRNQARDRALVQARELTRHAAHAIRAIHRGELEVAEDHLRQAGQLHQAFKTELADFPQIFYAGYTQDAIKEFVEANVTVALIQGHPLPLPDQLEVDPAVYLNGLAEAVGELRRRTLDILRKGYSEEAERLLACMDEIFALLITVDYPDAITNGLRRQTDLARGIIERTRGDLTTSLREERLLEALRKVSRQLDVDAG
ncbi:MAG TPA: haloacid dehalogenase [Chloroflexi bacterium]|jgi:translin|nr:haloacid dehalogenase [Chloroflexota bacterium]HPO58240.1 haloacid dehalogenase [Anaerolineaceae bacterium]